MSLFTPDVRVGRDETGRAALRAWFVKTLSEPKMSVHFVGNHIIDFDDADHARGIVYCRDELGRPNGGWDYGMLQYWDTYVRVEGSVVLRPAQVPAVVHGRRAGTPVPRRGRRRGP